MSYIKKHVKLSRVGKHLRDQQNELNYLEEMINNKCSNFIFSVFSDDIKSNLFSLVEKESILEAK